jgi:heme-degrading monooxygenase HmoA
MYAVIFRATVNELNSEYHTHAKRMRELAFSKYGCLDFINVTEGNQELAISYWESEEQIKKWKFDPEHLQTQELGKKDWYKDYQVQVAKIEREYEGESTR